MIDTGYFIEERPKHRRTVIRQALMYTPGAIIALVLLSISVWSIARGNYGALLAGIILALVSLSLVTQSVAAIRDLFAEPTTTTGLVRRAWTKGLWLGMFRSHYVLVQRAVFDVGVVVYSQTQEEDRLEIRHWPHSKTVISVRKLPYETTSQYTAGGSGPPFDREGDARGSMDATIGRIQAGPRHGPLSWP